MADLNWSIEKIVDCKGNDITTGGWVTISPMQGVGNTHASISVQPSEKYNDCETATVTISTGTGEKKYVTINRCNPQCNCDAIDFRPEVNIIPIGEDGGTVKVATYTMKYDCTDAYIGIVNTKSGCDYNIVNGTVYAVVGKNPSTTSDREFEYYVTYNGEKCNGGSQGGTYKGNFSQNRSIDKCEKENDCDNDISLDPEDFYVDYQGEIKTISINASDCWEVRAQDVSYSDVIESITFNNDGTESYIKFLRNNTTSEDYIEGLVKYFFTNTVTGKECEKSITYSQYPNPNPPVDCDNCGVVYSDTLTVYNPIPYAYTDGGTKALAAFTVDSNCQKLSFWFAANPGSIIDQNKANKITTAQSVNKITVLANYSPNGGSGSVINDNQTTAERSQEILCGVKGSSYPCLTIKLTQSGKPDTPIHVDCECRISSFESISNVDSNGTPTIRIFNLKDNGLCTSPTGGYVKYVFTGSYEGTTMVGCQYAALKTSAGLTIVVKDRSKPIVLAQGESITGTLSVYLSGCEDSTMQKEVTISRAEPQVKNANVYIRIGALGNGYAGCYQGELKMVLKITSSVAMPRDIKFQPLRIEFGETCPAGKPRFTHALYVTLPSGQTEAYTSRVEGDAVTVQGISNTASGAIRITSGNIDDFANSGVALQNISGNMPTTFVGSDGVTYNVKYYFGMDLTKNVENVII